MSHQVCQISIPGLRDLNGSCGSSRSPHLPSGSIANLAYCPALELRSARSESPAWNLIAWCTLLILANLLGFLYVSTWIRFYLQRHCKKPLKYPPVIPYMIPFVGHALKLFYDPVAALAQIR